MAAGSLDLILASRSPRRRELLAAAGYAFRVCPPSDAAESGLCSGETPPQLVARLAYQKAEDVVRRIDHGLVLACDTVAECGGQILGKPADRQDARRMLETLSARSIAFSAGCASGESPAASPWFMWTSRRCAWTDSRRDNLRNIWPATSGQARPARSATRTDSTGSTSSKAARRTWLVCRWNYWRRCWRDYRV